MIRKIHLTVAGMLVCFWTGTLSLCAVFFSLFHPSGMQLWDWDVIAFLALLAIIFYSATGYLLNEVTTNVLEDDKYKQKVIKFGGQYDRK